MIDIPTGTVTFLFTDIEGSTKLAQEFPDTLLVALEKHHSILNEAIENNNGFVYEIVGDAFCAAFENASDAVKAAYDAQLKLSKVKWDDAVIKVRMGIHSGNVEWNGKRYMGYITLARSARVMSAAYGEQILISNDAYELAKEKINVTNQPTPTEEIRNEIDIVEISFRDLGARRLKDVFQPIRLFQIVSPTLREDFPPIKTLDARPNNLPVQQTSFIGREEEIKQIKTLIKQTHLLAITGLGGTGKTRLALQVAADVIDDFANGVWFVELASLIEPSLLPQAIIKVFGLEEETKKTLEEILCDYLRDKEILIILDNCEHLIEACAKLSEKLLSNSPKLKIIASSREALRCEGEQTHRVLSLNTPDPKEKLSLEILSQYEAVRLFIERALSVDSTFRINDENANALVQICFQLDGIPLAIELASARTKVLSVEKIYERLNDRFNLLTGGKRTALPRQQTLRAMIDWSYDLLTEEERILWKRLSIFAGGWTLETSEEVCPDERIQKEEVLELLNQLTEKSILVFDKVKERYSMLETIRQYGKEKLNESNESEPMSINHLKYYIGLAESVELKLDGPEMQTYLEKLDSENSNFEGALSYSLKRKNIEEGVRLAGALGNFWLKRGRNSEGRYWLENAIESVQIVTKSVRGKALNNVGTILLRQGEYEKARKFIEEGYTMHLDSENKSGLAYSLRSLGHLEFYMGDYILAKDLFEQSLEIQRDLGNKSGVALSLAGLGNVVLRQGEFEEAENYFNDCLEISRDLGNKYGISTSLANLGLVASGQGKLDRANQFHQESLQISREIGDKHGYASNLNNLTWISSEQGEYEKAMAFCRESLALGREMGDKRGMGITLDNMGTIAFGQGKYERSNQIHKESLEIFREIGDKYCIAVSQSNLGDVALKLSEFDKAQKFYEESLILFLELGNKKFIVENIFLLTEILEIKGSYKKSVILAGFIHKVQEFLVTSQTNLYENRLLKLKEKIGAETFLEYFEEGKAMTLEQAAELALSNEL